MSLRGNWMVASSLVLIASAAVAAGKPVTEAEAKKKALSLFPGKVVEVERETRDGAPVFSVEIRGKDGKHEVAIRIADGAVLASKAASEEDEDEDEDDDAGK